MKKKSILLIIMVAIACLVTVTGITVYIVSSKNISAYEYLMKHSFKDLKPKQLLYQTVGNNDSEYLIFYVAEDDSINCAVIKESLLSFDIIHYSGKLPLNFKDSYLWSRYEDGTENGGGIAWGLIQDPQITDIYIGDMKCQQSQVEGQDFRIFWVLADEKEILEASLSNPGKMKEYTAIYD